MEQNVVFFDGDCAVCRRFIRNVAELDRNGMLWFAPLDGETSRDVLAGPNAAYRAMDALVLVEHVQSDRRRIWAGAQAVLRIYWLLGSRWVGWMHLLPEWLTGRVYRFLAKHRHRLRVGFDQPAGSKERMLP